MNKVLLVGYLASDPEVRASQKGTYVATMRIATNTYAGKAEDGTAKVLTQFHKGRLVSVEGSLQTSSWEDAASGQKRYKTEVVVDRLDFVGPKPQEAAAA